MNNKVKGKYMTVSKNRQMQGTIKKFNKQEHSMFDDKAKKVWLDYLNNVRYKDKNIKTIENPNIHGIDLISLNADGKVCFAWELEVRAGNWKGNVSFPFNSINCIERKDYQWRKDKEFIEKLAPFELADDCLVLYVQFNDLCNRAVVIEGDVILKQKLIPWSNRYVQNGEFVRQVPIRLTKEIIL